MGMSKQDSERAVAASGAVSDETITVDLADVRSLKAGTYLSDQADGVRFIRSIIGLTSDLEAKTYERLEQALAARGMSDKAATWRDCVVRYGLDSGAARGELLDLVRVAWGERSTIYEMFGPQGGSLFVFDLENGKLMFKASGGTTAGLRVAALEAVP